MRIPCTGRFQVPQGQIRERDVQFVYPYQPFICETPQQRDGVYDECQKVFCRELCSAGRPGRRPAGVLQEENREDWNMKHGKHFSRLLAAVTAAALLVPAGFTKAEASISITVHGQTWVLWETYGGDPDHDCDFTSEDCTTETVRDCPAGGADFVVCPVCGKKKCTSILYPCNHHYVMSVTGLSTATEDGLVTFTCSGCGRSCTEVLPAWNKMTAEGLKGPGSFGEDVVAEEYEDPEGGGCTGGHSWYLRRIDPTCEKDGGYYRICSVCGMRELSSVLEPAGHDYSPVLIRPASASEDGLRSYYCERCGDVYDEVIRASGSSSEGTVAEDPAAEAFRSKNAGSQNYTIYGSPVSSYLYQRDDGNFTRVEAGSGGVAVEVYSGDFELLNARMLPMELEVFGGFFAGEGYNFLIFGQHNENDDENREVFRVVRYTKDWQRVDHVSLWGENTNRAFRAGSLRCAEACGMLYILTCHEMFDLDGSGVHHQANAVVAIRESDMTVTDKYTGVANFSIGYVSHSFNQFILVDQYGRIVAMNHGDVVTRGASIYRYPGMAGEEKLVGSGGEGAVVYKSGGFPVVNETGMSIGGFEASSDRYLAALNSCIQDKQANLRDTRNIFVCASDQSDLSDVHIEQLTFLPDGGTESAGTPHLVRLSDSRFLVLWEELAARTDSRGTSRTGKVHCAFVDGHGVKQGDTGEFEGALSDCKPAVSGSRVIWYATDGQGPVFYSLDTESGRVSVTDTNRAPEPEPEPDPVPSDPGQGEAGSTPGQGLGSGSGQGSTGSSAGQGTGAAPGQGTPRPSQGAVLTPGHGSGTAAETGPEQIPGEEPWSPPGLKYEKVEEAFIDITSSHWAAREILTALNMDLVKGKPGRIFDPAGKVSTAEFCAMLTRYFCSGELGPEGSPWWLTYVQTAQDADMLHNTAVGSFYDANRSYPDTVQDPVSRLDMAMIMYNLLKTWKVQMPAESEIQAAAARIPDFDTVPAANRTSVLTCYALGLLQGNAAGEFTAYSTMSRAEACTAAVRMIDCFSSAAHAS